MSNQSPTILSHQLEGRTVQQTAILLGWFLVLLQGSCSASKVLALKKKSVWTTSFYWLCCSLPYGWMLIESNSQLERGSVTWLKVTLAADNSFRENPLVTGADCSQNSHILFS